MCKGFFYILFVLFSCSVSGQDSIQDIQKPKKKILFSFDARRSVALQEPVKIGGLKIGFRSGDNYQFGIGFYGMNDPIKRAVVLNKDLYPDSKDTMLFDFDYTTLFFDKIWYHSKRWELATPFHFGIGTLKLDYLTTDLRNPRKQFIKGAAFTTELSFTAQYKIVRWFAIGTGFGYRKILVNDEKLSKSLNAPAYIFQMKLLIGQLYKSVFKKEDNPDDW